MGIPSYTCGVRKRVEAEISTSSSPVSNYAGVTPWARFQGYDTCASVVSAHQQCAALHLSSFSKDKGRTCALKYAGLFSIRYLGRFLKRSRTALDKLTLGTCSDQLLLILLMSSNPHRKEVASKMI